MSDVTPNVGPEETQAAAEEPTTETAAQTAVSPVSAQTDDKPAARSPRRARLLRPPNRAWRSRLPLQGRRRRRAAVPRKPMLRLRRGEQARGRQGERVLGEQAKVRLLRPGTPALAVARPVRGLSFPTRWKRRPWWS